MGFSQVSIPVQPCPYGRKELSDARLWMPIPQITRRSRGLVSDFKAVMEDAKTIIAAAFPYLENSNSRDRAFTVLIIRPTPRAGMLLQSWENC